MVVALPNFLDNTRDPSQDDSDAEMLQKTVKLCGNVRWLPG